MLLDWNTHRIAVTGIQGGGKTVFLTSLLWQLIEFADADFHFGGGARIEGFREVRQVPDAGNDAFETFPLESYRDALSRNGRWPRKTTDCARYVCEYRRSDRRGISLRRLAKLQWSSRQRLELFDFPGERIADAAIAAFADYAAWSDHILGHFESHGDYREATADFLQTVKADAAPAAEIVLAYKRALGRLIVGYKPLVSPSVFLLDPSGDAASAASPEELAATRLAGLSEDEQFAPLPAAVRQGRGDLASAMAERYRRYRRRLVLPVFEQIGRSDGLVVLVDIPSLLMGGVGRYNDNRQILLDLFDALRGDESMVGQLLRLLQFWRGGPSRVALVATKADMVHPDDVESGRLESLLKQMTGRARQMLPDVTFEWFVCSACRSTRRADAPGRIIGQLTYDNPERRTMEFAVSSLPETWPGDWQPGQFRFHRVEPQAPRNLQVPPAQLGLDRIFEFLTT